MCTLPARVHTLVSGWRIVRPSGQNAVVEKELDDRIDAAIGELERLAAQETAVFVAQNRQLAMLVDLCERAREADGVDRFLEMHVAGTLRIGQMSAASRLAEATQLVRTLPLTLEALADGRLLLPQARAVLRETQACDSAVAVEVDRRLTTDTGELTGWTARRLATRLKALVLTVEAELAPDATARRHSTARSGRRVRLRPEPDGMTGLWALLPAEQAQRFAQGLDELTRRQAIADLADGTTRTADQRRADVLAALPALALSTLDHACPYPGSAGGAVLPAQRSSGAPAPLSAVLGAACTASPMPRSGTGSTAGPVAVAPLPTAAATAGSVVVHVHVPLATALGRSSAPGTLTGYGPVSAQHVRRLLPTAQLHRVLVDPTTGRPVAADPPPRRLQHLPDVPRTREQVRAELLAMLPRDTDAAAHQAPGAAGEPQYRPSAALARFVRLRDPLCVAPGCSRDSTACDLDHHTPYPEGSTSAGNLAPLSRRCHRAKTVRWRVRRHPDGSSTWTDRGRSYAVPPSWLPPPEVGNHEVQDLDADTELLEDDGHQTLVQQLRPSGTAAEADPSPVLRVSRDDEPPF